MEVGRRGCCLPAVEEGKLGGADGGVQLKREEKDVVIKTDGCRG